MRYTKVPESLIELPAVAETESLELSKEKTVDSKWIQIFIIVITLALMAIMLYLLQHNPLLN